MGGFAVLLAAEKEVGVVYPDSRILVELFDHYFEEVICFLESWSQVFVAGAFNREISYLSLAGLDIDTG